MKVRELLSMRCDLLESVVKKIADNISVFMFIITVIIIREISFVDSA
jgi:hypothetical protein